MTTIKRAGFVDVDLLDKGTRFPNLALMKLAGFYRERGVDVKLCLTSADAEDRDKLLVSKVFTASKAPEWLRRFDGRSELGGTGFNLFAAKSFPPEVEHCKPFYDLYAPFVKTLSPKRSKVRDAYAKASIGFTSRGCFRQCSFCVNRAKTKSERWSPVSEFLDASRPYVFLLDDNVFACKDWREIFDELNETGKAFAFKQGLDIRLTSPDKARALAESKTYGDLYVAFDRLKDEREFRRGAKILRDHCNKQTRAFLLTGFYARDEEELDSLFKRIEVVSEYGILPYVMRHERLASDAFRALYVDVARWANQAQFFKKRSFAEFCGQYGSKRSRELIASNELREFVPVFERTFWRGL